MSKIKLVDEKTDLSNIKPFDWDLNIKGVPYYVCRLNEYIHSIGGTYGENNLWCYPRNETPTFKNLIKFNGTSVRWSFTIKDNNYIKCKWGETEVLHNHIITIFRNDKEFYSFGSAGVTYGVGKALEIIGSIDEHPLSLNEIDFDKKIIGRKVWWYDSPAIITRYIDQQACVILEPDGVEKFPVPNCFKNENIFVEEDIKTEIFDKHIWWFRD